LKLNSCSISNLVRSPSSASSTRTRIETVLTRQWSLWSILRALHPREQGLKLEECASFPNAAHLRALHPREQGLKLRSCLVNVDRRCFERFIHENKD